MGPKEACEGRACTLERTLPFAGPLLALAAMLVTAVSATFML